MKKLLIGCFLISSVANADFIERTTISSDPFANLGLGLGYKAHTWSTEVNAALHSTWQDVGLSLNQHANYTMNEMLIIDSFVGVGVKNVIGKKDWFLQSGMSVGTIANNVTAQVGAAWKWDFKKSLTMYPMMNLTLSL